MPFTPKDWRDKPDTATPITAATLEDLETRLAAYADTQPSTVPGPPGSTGGIGPTGPPGVGANWRGVWSSGTTYALGDGAFRNGLPYVSNIGSNLNHDPATDTGTNWGYLNFSPWQPVDALSASPRSVTDWGTIINTAVVAGVRKFLFGPFDYPYTTALNLKDIQGITFQGSGAHTWSVPAGGTGPYSRLNWTASSGGRVDGSRAYAIDSSGTTDAFPANSATSFLDMMFLYTNPGWTGGLINLREATNVQFQRCFISSDRNLVPTSVAYVGLHCGNSNAVTLLDCTVGGFQFGIRGREQDTDINAAGRTVGHYSQGLSIIDCTFGGDGVALCNPGETWLARGCTFEMNAAGYTGPTITTDYNYATGFVGQLTLRDCSFWDALGNGMKLLYVPSGTPMAFHMYNCTDYNASGSIAKLLDHQGNGEMILENNSIKNICDFGDGNNSGSFKQRAIATGNGVFYPSATDMFPNLDTHRHILSLGNSEHFDLGGNQLGHTNDGLIELKRERMASNISGIYTPTAAAHSGAVNISSVGITGTDIAGVLAITIGAGGASNTGPIADVTLNRPLPSVNNPFQWGIPGVLLTPIGYNGATSFAASFYAAQPFISALQSSPNTGWTLGVVNALPANAVIYMFYRVMQL